MDSKLLGSILLIVGTSLGAGMLGLPIVAAQLGFLGSLLLLVSCWFIMTAGAYLILEVNLWLPQNSNLISMAKATIGPLGQVLAWLTYLLLLYSLLCAYIAGGSDLLHNLIQSMGLSLPLWLSAILFTVIFSSITYLGIRAIDQVNRGLMFLKLGAYFILIIILLPLLDPDKMIAGNLSHISQAGIITVTITSFGYAAIIPSLRIYFAGNIPKLKKAILLGSFIPLVIYILWDLVIMGILPLHGENSLSTILSSPNSTSELVNTLNAQLQTPFISSLIKIFTSVCVLTSFLGVSLCLTDFFADGLRLEKTTLNKFLIHLITFLPSLTLALFFPNLFIKALSYAGIYCIILLILLPAWMAWNGRYKRGIAKGFRVGGGKLLLGFLILLSLSLLVNCFFV